MIAKSGRIILLASCLIAMASLSESRKKSYRKPPRKFADETTPSPPAEPFPIQGTRHPDYIDPTSPGAQALAVVLFQEAMNKGLIGPVLLNNVSVLMAAKDREVNETEAIFVFGYTFTDDGPLPNSVSKLFGGGSHLRL